MEYQKIINLKHNTSNQSSKHRTKHWVEINDAWRVMYKTNGQIELNTTIKNQVYVMTVMHTYLLKGT